MLRAMSLSSVTRFVDIVFLLVLVVLTIIPKGVGGQLFSLFSVEATGESVAGSLSRFSGSPSSEVS